jgi:hypothetical protein
MNDHQYGALIYTSVYMGWRAGAAQLGALKLVGARSAAEALVNDLQRVADRQWRVDDEIDR